MIMRLGLAIVLNAEIKSTNLTNCGFILFKGQIN